jgi:signal transduction histidine kinase
VQAKRLLTIAHANSQRLVRLVNNILDMERIESGKVVFVQKRLEIRSLVEEAIEANRGFADGFGVRIRLNEASAAGDIRGDPDWLLQVVTNLLSNAVKFSPPAGEVEVAIENLSGAIRISCETTATVFRRTSSRVFSRSLPSRRDGRPATRRHRPRAEYRQADRRTARRRGEASAMRRAVARSSGRVSGLHAGDCDGT